MTGTQQQSGMARERDQTGKYVERASLEEILDLFDEVPRGVVTSRDVADHFDISSENARQKLTRLFDRGHLDFRQVGRTKLYWRIEDE